MLIESGAVLNLKIIEAKIQELLSKLHEVSGKDISLTNTNGAEDLERSMGGPESIYALIWVYLQSLGISQVEQILFVADGAVWIWDCLQALRSLLQLRGIRCQIVELLDMYHAVQQLTYS